MRSYYLLVLIITICCNCTSSKPKGTIELLFEIQKKTKQDLVISYMKDIMVRIPIDSLGKGRYIIDNMDAGHIILHNGLSERRMIYAEKGDCLDIKYDGENFANSLSVTGGNPSIIEYLGKVVIHWLDDSSYKLDVTSFNEKLCNQLVLNLKELETFDFEGNCERFRKLEENRIRYMMSMSLLQYPEGHRWATQCDYVPEEMYYRVLKEWMIEDPDLLEIPEYRTLMTEGSAFIAGQDGNFKNVYERTLGQIKYITATMRDKKVIEYLISYLACRYHMDNGIDGAQELDQLCRLNVSDKDLLTKYNELYNSWEKLLPGKPFPYFEAVDSLGVVKNLKDYTGKNICLYVWQSYYPCISEFTYLKELETLFADKNIMLVCISLDSDKNKWRSTLRKETFGVADQLYLGDDKTFQQAIKYRSIKMSQFYLIDTKGNIVEWELPKPSTGTLGDFLSHTII